MAEAEPAVQQDVSPPDDRPAEKLVTAGPPAAQAGGILTVDLAAIEANWRALGRRVMPAECAAVIKADGYGCGIEQVAGRAGARRLQDLLRRRSRRGAARCAAQRRSRRSMCSTACCRAPRPAFADIHARPVIGSMVELAEWDAFCSAKPVARRRRAACRHRHEPARHFGERSGGARAAHPLAKTTASRC